MGQSKEGDNEALIKALILYCIEEELTFNGDVYEEIPLSPEGRKNIKELLSGWMGSERAEALLKKVERENGWSADSEQN